MYLKVFHFVPPFAIGGGEQSERYSKRQLISGDNPCQIERTTTHIKRQLMSIKTHENIRSNIRKSLNNCFQIIYQLNRQIYQNDDQLRNYNVLAGFYGEYQCLG